MIIILSQKVDSDSTYTGDEAFRIYHYPARYRNQIHTGDTFVYYQGNRFDKSQRYYFGTGQIGEITQRGEEDYFAELVNTVRFETKVPIYLPDTGYVEQLGYQTVRKSVNPPWQSSIRPLSEDAYKYIMEHSGCSFTVDTYNAQLKQVIQRYYLENDRNALLEIRDIAQKLSVLFHLQ